MNPRSGGGKVGKSGLKEKAEALGAEVALLEGPGVVDVAALARQAVADGADLLGVAGGDGTQALVAGIAAEHDLPFLVISAGTATTSRWTSGWIATTRPPAWTP
jgi:diacylglycerol kinase family enzyme